MGSTHTPAGVGLAHRVPVHAVGGAAKAHAGAQHPGRKRAGRNGVEHNAVFGQVRGHKAREVVHGRLGRAIRKHVKRRAFDAVNRADIDHPRRACALPRRAQERQQLLRQKEHAFDVGVHHLVPAHFGKLVQRRAPGGPGVVHQNVERGLALGQLGCQAFYPGQGGQVGGQGDALAAVGLAQALGCGLAGVGFARGDIDLGTLGQKAGGNHLANAARAAGHQRGFALDRKEVRKVGVHKKDSVKKASVRPWLRW